MARLEEHFKVYAPAEHIQASGLGREGLAEKARIEVAKVSEVSLTVNGVDYKVLNEDPKLTLNEWLRDHLHLTGTKLLCGEGGCGSCVVSVSKEDPSTNPETIQAVNSCLCPLMSLDGCHVITVEGLGNKTDGFHEIQKRFAANFASQCGYCTPGFIMNGYSALASGSCKTTEKDIEDCFDGNICRCTGYRPILDAVKSFAKECSTLDIEDLRKSKTCTRSCVRPRPKIMVNTPQQGIKSHWLRPSNLNDLYRVMARFYGQSVKYVSGSTGVGVFKEEGPFDVHVDLGNVQELNKFEMRMTGIEIGARVSLTKMATFFDNNVKVSASFLALSRHIKQIANVPVRNVATWAGNLMMKHAHPFFPSDIFLMLETAGAQLNIAEYNGNIVSCGLHDFLTMDMGSKIILSMTLPLSKPDEVFQTYKIMPRKQNSYAYVHAGFRAKFDQESLTIKGRPTIAFGGMGLKMARATEAENSLCGKSLEDKQTFEDAISLIEESLEPNPENKLVDFEYCKRVALNLFYKFCVALRGPKVQKKVFSANSPFERPVSSGKQFFHVSEEAAPLNQPLEKIEGKLQASGEVMFTTDVPMRPNEVHAAFVLSEMGNATLGKIDAEQASRSPGFIGMFTAQDIPGVNKHMHGTKQGEILAESKIDYAGQIIAVIVADTQRQADELAKCVKVEYKDISKPIITVEDAIEKQSFHPARTPDLVIGNTETAFNDCDHVISGEVKSGGQHHFYIEPQNCLVAREEHDYKVFSSTQCTRDVQAGVAKALGINASSVDVQVTRVGGAFGGKYQYPPKIAAACAVAAQKLDRPVRTFMNIDDNLKAIGTRSPILSRYKVGFSKEGYLQAIDIDVFAVVGFYPNCEDGPRVQMCIDNAYYCPNWKISVTECKTNTPFNTYFRGPGNIQGMFAIETIMDHVAAFIGDKTAEEIKEINFYKSGQRNFIGFPLKHCLLNDVWTEIKLKSEFDNRRIKIAKFNEEHRWRKRGIALMPLKYDHCYLNFNFNALVSIYYADGTVAISHGGIEMGQGINSRIRTVAAAKLGIPVEYISVKPTTTIASANSIETGASVTSEMNCVAVYKCCEILLERIAPFKAKFPNATWKELIKECANVRVDLTATQMYHDAVKDIYAYTTYGAACSEVEIDILTGEMHVLRSDIMYDCGESVNPCLDIGQVEGAFVQGMGYFLSEKVAYDSESGEQLTTNTWEYKPPMSKDIPIDMRVYLLHQVPNPLGFIRSKAVGEPAICLSASCVFAAKNAIAAARQDLGQKQSYFRLDGPATVDKIQKLVQVTTEDLYF